MTLHYGRTRRPSLEAYKTLLKTALLTDLPEALSIVTADAVAKGLPNIPLPMVSGEDKIRIVTSLDPRLIESPPVIIINGWNVRSDGQGQQPGTAHWMGTVVITLFIATDDFDAQSAMIDRYGEALWMVAINQVSGLMDGKEVLDDGMRIEPGPAPGQSAALRAVEFSYDVSFRT